MYEHLTLGAVADTLQHYIEDLADGESHLVRWGFRSSCSYRGDYSQLAFQPASNSTLREMVATARDAVDHTYQGYKGGDNTMHVDTPTWLAEYGHTGPPMTDGLLHAMVYGNLWEPGPPKHHATPNIAALESKFSGAIDCAPFLDFEPEEVFRLVTEWCLAHTWQLTIRLQVPGVWCVTLDPDRNRWDTITVEGDSLRVVLMRACLLAAAENVKE